MWVWKYISFYIVLNSQVHFMEGVSTQRQFLNEHRILSDILDGWIWSFLEDVDNISRLNLCLSVSFFLLWTSRSFHLSELMSTLALTPRLKRLAKRIMNIYFYINWGGRKITQHSLCNNKVLALQLYLIASFS